MPPRSANAITWKPEVLPCAAATSFRSSVANANTRTRRKVLLSEFRKGRIILVNVDSPFGCGQLFRGHRRIKLQVEESHHHFIPALLSPYHALGWVRILRIVRRIVEMRRAFNLSALRENNGFREVVPKLPMPVIDRHAQDGLLPAVREYQSVLER